MKSQLDGRRHYSVDIIPFRVTWINETSLSPSIFSVDDEKWDASLATESNVAAFRGRRRTTGHDFPDINDARFRAIEHQRRSCKSFTLLVRCCFQFAGT